MKAGFFIRFLPVLLRVFFWVTLWCMPVQASQAPIISTSSDKIRVLSEICKRGNGGAFGYKAAGCVKEGVNGKNWQRFFSDAVVQRWEDGVFLLVSQGICIDATLEKLRAVREMDPWQKEILSMLERVAYWDQVVAKRSTPEQVRIQELQDPRKFFKLVVLLIRPGLYEGIIPYLQPRTIKLLKQRLGWWSRQGSFLGETERKELCRSLWRLYVNARDSDGKTPLHLACEKLDTYQVRQLLLEGADLNSRDNGGNLPLWLAYRSASRGGSRDYDVPLHDIARSLIEYGLKGETMVGPFSTVLRLACEENWLKEVQELALARNHGLYIPDECGMMPLHYVCAKGFYDLAKFLVEQGAWLDARDCEGRTALHYAAASGHYKLVSYLLSRGADAFALDDYGNIPLSLAYKLAIEKGGIYVSYLHDIVRLLLKYGLKGETMVGHYCTALRLACEGCWLEEVQELVLAGNHGLYIPDEFGITPLHYVCAKGFYDLATFFIDHGAWIDIRDSYGQTPLHHAAARGRDELVYYLLRCGADLFARDDDGLTPYDRARLRGRLAAWEAVLRAQMKKNSIVKKSKVMSDEQTAGLDWLETWAPRYYDTLQILACAKDSAQIKSNLIPVLAKAWVLRKRNLGRRRIFSGVLKPRHLPLTSSYFAVCRRKEKITGEVNENF
jgi:ankyrin repeat protein